MTKIIKIPKGFKAEIWVQNNSSEGRKFYFRNPSLVVVNESEDFGQEKIKIIFRKISYRKKGE